MLMPLHQVRVFVCTQAQDMRYSFNGLYGLVKDLLGEDPLSGSCYVFMNKRRTHMKVLYYERGGLCVWAKRLERGTFEGLSGSDGEIKRVLTLPELTMLLDGVDLSSVKRRKRLVM